MPLLRSSLSRVTVLLAVLFGLFVLPLHAQSGLVDHFDLAPSDLALTRLAQPNTYLDKAGHRFALLGDESGRFEAWAYPLKLLRNFEFSFFVGSSTSPIRAADIVHTVTVTPEAATLRYVYQSFTIDATVVVPPDEPGALILLRVQADEPLTIVCGFLPALQPMWPAGIGGQRARWDDALKAYHLSEPTWKNNGFVGSPAAEGLSYTPAHMLSDTPNEFRIVVADPDAVREAYVPVILAGGNQGREAARAVYERLAADPEGVYRETAAYYRRLRERTLRVDTPDDSLDLALEWAKVSFDNLVVDNPDLGRGLVAGLGTSGTGGRPGFGWFFGGDAAVNSYSLNGLGAHATVRDALAFQHPFQRDDGKMAHEVTQAAAYLDWFGDYPYAYIHAETSPFYITALYDYVRMTDDRAFLREAWPVARRAYAWSRATDANGDGLMDNAEAGLGALEFGALTGIATDIYLGAIWTRATYAMAELARLVGDDETAREASADYGHARRAFDERFWDEAWQQYSYAFNPDGRHVEEVTPWSAVGLMWGLGRPDRADASLRKLASAELATDWGIRMISVVSDRFEPLNYNYGAVWPFLTSWVAMAQFKHNRAFAAYPLLAATAHLTFERALGHVNEVFSGARHTWPQEAVAHQGFCTAGVVLPFVRGLLGLEGSAPDRHLVVEPRLPAHWDTLAVDGYRLGDATFDLRFRRRPERLTVTITQHGGTAHRLTFSPVFGPGTRVEAARVNGAAVDAEVHTTSHAVQSRLTTDLSSTTIIEMDLDPAVEVIPPVHRSRVGSPNEGLKIIDLEATDGRLTVDVEGRAGRAYTLSLVHADRLTAVEGAVRDGDRLRLTMPDAPGGAYVRHRVVLTAQ